MVEAPAPVEDDWTGFATAGKKKKGKKGKDAEPEVEPPKDDPILDSVDLGMFAFMLSTPSPPDIFI